MAKRLYYASKVKDDLREEIRSALRWIGWEDLPRNQRVFLKPNFTYPYYKTGVTTRPEFIDALCAVLRERTEFITIGESNGGYHSWTAEEAFKGHKIDEISQRWGVRVVNLSKQPRTTIKVRKGWNSLDIPWPKIFSEEFDIFMTLPVPKVHCMTRLTMALKNQWGCIPDTMRLRNHWAFSESILALNQALPKIMVMSDAFYMLDRNGPMDGDPVEMGLVLASNDIWSFEKATCRLMGVNLEEVPYLKLAQRMGLLPSLEEISFNEPLEKFCTRKFRLERTTQNYVALSAFRSKLLTTLGYDSKLGDLAHAILYKIRGRPVWRVDA